jgi:hypothetical protein
LGMREIRFGVGASYAPGPLVLTLKIVRFLSSTLANW